MTRLTDRYCNGRTVWLYLDETKRPAVGVRRYRACFYDSHTGFESEVWYFHRADADYDANTFLNAT
jgi:hypothetical protein